MPYKKPALAVFGDSWAHGAELPEPLRHAQCFGGQLASRLGTDDYLNFGIPGTGIAHLHLQLNHLINEHRDRLRSHRMVAVFFLSGRERFLFFDENQEYAHVTASVPIVRECQQHLVNEFRRIQDFYLRHIQSYSGDWVNLNMSLMALQARCRHHGIADFYLSGWQPLELWEEIDRSKIYGQGNRTCADILGIEFNHDGDMMLQDNQFIRPHGSHPNQQGHELIANELYQMISEYIDLDLNNP